MDENTKGKVNDEELEEEEVDQGKDTGTDSANETGDSGDSGKDKKKERSFSQAQVKRMMTREKNQGRAAAYKELGIDPQDTKMIKMFQAFVESQKTDDQKAAEQSAEARKKQLELEERALKAEAKAEAMILGVKPQYVDDAVALALSRMSDDTELKTVLGELKEKYSQWFDEDDEDDESKGSKSNEGSNGANKTGQKGTGSSVKDAGHKGGKSSMEGIGAKLAAQRKTAGGRPYYWGKH